MRIRTIALALPVVIGFAACKTSSTQGSRTASSDRQAAEASGAAQARARGDAASGEASPSTAGTPSGSASASTSGDMGSTASGDLKAHTDDRVVSGKISSVSTDSLTIMSADGTDKTLQLVPQTTVRVDGQSAQTSDLQEGQEVRASYSETGGRDVAVEIRAGSGMMNDSGSMHDSGSMNNSGSMHESGSSGYGPSSSGSSGSGTTDTGSSPSGSSGTTDTDRRY